MCNKCEHRDVCGTFKSTGGYIKNCPHYKEERKGVWVQSEDGEFNCSECDTRSPGTYSNADVVLITECRYCHNCGASMEGIKYYEDQGQ